MYRLDATYLTCNHNNTEPKSKLTERPITYKTHPSQQTINPNFWNRDAVATCLLEEWSLTADLFDCDSLEGPVPRLFTANLEDAKKNFTTNLDLAYKDLSRLTNRFFTTENLHPLQAMTYLDNPK